MSYIRTSLPPQLRRHCVAAVTAAAAVGAVMLAVAPSASAATNPPTFGPQIGLGSGFSQPYDVAVNGAGDILVADNGSHTIDKITANGSVTTQLASVNNNDLTFAVASDSAGNVYWADWQNGDVYRLAAVDNTTSVVVTGLTGAHALAFDKNDNMFIATGGSVYEKAAGSSGQTATLYADGFVLVTGLAADAQGDLFVADGANASNDVTEVTASPRGYVHLPITGLNNPGGLALDSDGDLFIAGGGANNVVMYTPGGAQSTVGSGYISPEGVAVNAQGDVIVADTYNSRVVSNPSVDPQTITLTTPIPTTAATGSTLGVAASGGGSGNPVVFSVDTATSYPSDTCKIVPGGKRVQFTKTGTCVLDINQAGAARYLRGLVQRFGPHYDLVVAAYNAGPRAVLEYGGIPPYYETENYVVRVLDTWQHLARTVRLPANAFATAPHGLELDYWLDAVQ